MSKYRGLYVALGVVGALVVLVGGVGVAYAQGPQPPVGDRAVGGPVSCDAGSHTHGAWMRGGRGFGMRGDSMVGVVAEVTGLTEDEVVAALQEGQTFAQVAEAQGVDPAVIVDAFLTERETALEAAVEEGWLTQAQVDERLAEMADHLSEHLDEAWNPRFSGEGRFSSRPAGRGSFGRGSRSGFTAPAFSGR